MRVLEQTLVFSQKRFQGWILDAFWQESSNALNFAPNCVYLHSSKTRNRTLGKRRLLKQISGKAILSIHQSNLLHLENIGILDSIVPHNILVTHVNSEEEYRELCSHYHYDRRMRLLVMNKGTELALTDLGIPKEDIGVVYGAVERRVFYPSKMPIAGDYILIAGDCKLRKNPEMIRDLILKTPDLKFVFESEKWKKIFPNAEQLNSNISFWDSSALNRGDLYRNASALCNLSLLEGGPITVLQALASGTPVLSSDVGFVSEVLVEDFGRIIDLDLTIQEISVLLREVASTKELVSTQDGLEGKFSWEDLGRNLFAFAD
jgi:glycosyltransferase involved in cell wall biosynthesis